MKTRPNSWVQTPRETHEVWARLCAKNKSAAALMHLMVAKMGNQNALVVSQATLAELLGVTDRTIRSAISYLVANRWLEVVRIGKGREAAYVVNDRVAWGEKRNKLRLSLFSATVVAASTEQDEDPEEQQLPLRKIPVIYPWELQAPSGPGEEPPSQPELIETDLPTRESSKLPRKR